MYTLYLKVLVMNLWAAFCRKRMRAGDSKDDDGSKLDIDEVFASDDPQFLEAWIVALTEWYASKWNYRWSTRRWYALFVSQSVEQDMSPAFRKFLLVHRTF